MPHPLFPRLFVFAVACLSLLTSACSGEKRCTTNAECGTTAYCNVEQQVCFEHQPPTVTTNSLPAALVGEPFAATLEAQSTALPLRWSIARTDASLGWLSMSTDGRLSGVAAGVLVDAGEVVVRAEDAVGQASEKTLALSVAGCREAEARQCVLHVKNSGNGRVTSSGGELDCGERCSVYLPVPTTTTLTAAPEAGFDFVGWAHPGCSGFGGCAVSVDAPALLATRFSPAWSRGYSHGASFGIIYGVGVTLTPSAELVVAGGRAVAKVRPFGDDVWIQNVPSTVVLTGVATNADGSLFVVGTDNNTNGRYTWYRHLNAAGGEVISRTLSLETSPAASEGNAIAVDANGAVFLVGKDRQGGQGNDISLRKMISGAPEWVRTKNGPVSSDDEGRAVALGPGGKLYVAGIVTSLQGSDGWVARYSAETGTIEWSATYSGAAGLHDRAEGVSVAADGTFVVVGSEQATSSNTNAWIRRYSAEGAPLWTRTFAGAANGGDVAFGVTHDSEGNVYVTGYETMASGDLDAWLAKYSADGTRLWVRYHDGGHMDLGRSVVVGPDRAVYVGILSMLPGGSATQSFVRRYAQ